MQVYRVEKNIYANVPYIRVLVGVACQMKVERKIPSCVKMYIFLYHEFSKVAIDKASIYSSCYYNQHNICYENRIRILSSCS